MGTVKIVTGVNTEIARFGDSPIFSIEYHIHQNSHEIRKVFNGYREIPKYLFQDLTKSLENDYMYQSEVVFTRKVREACPITSLINLLLDIEGVHEIKVSSDHCQCREIDIFLSLDGSALNSYDGEGCDTWEEALEEARRENLGPTTNCI